MQGDEDIFDEVVTVGPSTGATHLGKGDAVNNFARGYDPSARRLLTSSWTRRGNWRTNALDCKVPWCLMCVVEVPVPVSGVCSWNAGPSTREEVEAQFLGVGLSAGRDDGCSAGQTPSCARILWQSTRMPLRRWTMRPCTTFTVVIQAPSARFTNVNRLLVLIISSLTTFLRFVGRLNAGASEFQMSLVLFAYSLHALRPHTDHLSEE